MKLADDAVLIESNGAVHSSISIYDPVVVSAGFESNGLICWAGNGRSETIHPNDDFLRKVIAYAYLRDFDDMLRLRGYALTKCWLF